VLLALRVILPLGLPLLPFPLIPHRPDPPVLFNVPVHFVPPGLPDLSAGVIWL
jgi:hypothetical protein